MMKIKFVKYIPVVVLVTILTTISSCKKQLDLAPTDSFTEALAYLSIDDLQRGLNTVYARYSPESRGLASATISDELKFGPDNAGQFQFEYRFQYNADVTSGGATLGTYGNMYAVIDQANRVMEAFSKVPSPNGLADEARKNVIKGQLLAFRAMGHFELLQQYAKKYNAADPLGVPLVLVSDLLGKPKRNTVIEVITQIEKDLVDARALLAVPASAAAYDDKFINQLVVDGVRARVALYKGEWDNAKNYATNVIVANLRPLETGANFTDIWTDAQTNKEVLLRFRRGTASYGANYTTTGNAVYMSPSDKLTSTLAATTGDIRTNSYLAISSGKRIVNKFFTSAAGARINDWKEMRIAEMYLIRAEAYAQLAITNPANLALGAADLNLLRTNRITGYTNASFADGNALLDAVRVERYKELAFEGFRLFDLKRWGLDVVRNASDVSSTNWQTLPASNHRFQFPIPAPAVLANQNLVQNINY